MRAVLVGLFVATALLVAPRPVPATAQPQGLDVVLRLDRSAYEPGTPIGFTVLVRNTGASPVTLNFTSTPRFDLVLSSDLVVLDRWSRDRMPTALPGQERLSPGGVLVYSGTWQPRSDLLPSAPLAVEPQPLPRGVFRVEAVFITADFRLASRPEPLIIGAPTSLPQGCTTLPFLFSLELPVEVVARALESPDALAAFWQRSLVLGIHAGYHPTAPTASDLRVVNRLYPLTVCLNFPSRMILP